MWTVELAVMAAMIAVNGVFAAFEIGLASVSSARLKRLAAEGRPGAGAALAMKGDMEASLAVVQLGVTLCGAIAAAVGGAGAEQRIAPALVAVGLSAALAEALAIALVVLPLTAVTIIFGELVPKVFALRNPESTCLALAPGMRLFNLCTWPAVWVIDALVGAIMSWGAPAARAEAAEIQDLRASAAVARASRLIGPREEGIILGAAALRSRPVREIMLPADGIHALAADASLADNLIAAHLDMHTRFPVFERAGDPQSAIGYVNVKDIMAAVRQSPHTATVRALVRPLPGLDERLPISDCLERMMHEHTHIALVRDDAGRAVGMVTLEDILEELVGDIQDEYDRLPTHLIPSGAGWVAGGGATLARLKENAGLDLPAIVPEAPAATLAEWVAARLGRDPRGGDLLQEAGVRVVVRKVRRSRMYEALVTSC